MSEAQTQIDVEDQGHDHDHPWFLGHHWESPKQQFEAGKLGMWLFLATEVLLFGGLFCAYAVWRGNHPDLFQFGSKELNTTLGAINTAVLIASSLSMAWAVTAAQQNKQTLLKIMLILTLAGAVTFLVIKYFEYTHKFNEGIFPGLKYYEVPGEDSHTFKAETGVYTETLLEIPVMTPVLDMSAPPSELSTVSKASFGPGGFDVDALHAVESGEEVAVEDASHEEQADEGHVATAEHTHHLQDPLRPQDAHMFYNIYFMMTGLHGIHVLIGIIVISWLLINSFKGKFNHEYFTPVDLGGLYWHVVDLIWIFLFPLFYLI